MQHRVAAASPDDYRSKPEDLSPRVGRGRSIQTRSDRIGTPLRRGAVNAAFVAGAGMVAASGLIHLYLWADGYRNVATIGPLFLAQGFVGLILAVVLVAWPRVATAGVSAAYLLASIGALVLSATQGLFGFVDTLDAPWASTTLIVEAAGLAVLVVVGALVALQADVHSTRSA